MNNHHNRHHNHHHHSKVLFITKKRSTDYHDSYQGRPVGLLNSATFTARALNLLGIEAKAVAVTDNNDIDREVHHYKPTHVVIEALWVVPAKFDVLLKLHPSVKWVVRIHSKAPFLALEGVAFKWIMEYLKIGKKYGNLFLSTNNKEFNRELEEVEHQKILYLPNIYCPPQYNLECKPLRCGNEINIGCFGAIRPLKNHMMQAIAATKFAEDLRLTLNFHINSTVTEQRGQNVLKNLKAFFEDKKHKLIEHPWMSHEEFINLVNQMDIGMQVSFSESFNIVTADFVDTGIPIVVSNDITWMTKPYKCDPNSGKEMVDTLKLAWSLHRFKYETINKTALAWYNVKATKEWLAYLKRK